MSVMVSVLLLLFLLDAQRVANFPVKELEAVRHHVANVRQAEQHERYADDCVQHCHQATDGRLWRDIAVANRGDHDDRVEHCTRHRPLRFRSIIVACKCVKADLVLASAGNNERLSLFVRTVKAISSDSMKDNRFKIQQMLPRSVRPIVVREHILLHSCVSNLCVLINHAKLT